MQAALERAMADLAFGPAVDPNDPSAIDAWLARNGVADHDAAAIVEQGIDRLLVYRRLVRGNLRDAIDLQCERAVARLGDSFDEYLDRFLAERGPRTHYLRDVATEFLDFCEPLWRADPRIPRYVLDLARHENLQVEIAAMQAASGTVTRSDLVLDAGVRFIEAARVVRYEHAVHELADDPDDRTVPAARATALLAYRSPDHEVRYLELTPLAARILELLLQRKTLREAVLGGCALEGAAVTSSVLGGTAALLADLADRGALLGAG